MKVFRLEVIQEYCDLINGKALEGFEDDSERFNAIHRFRKILDMLEPIPRAEDDPLIIPVLRQRVGKNHRPLKNWICPSCGCVLGDFGTIKDYTQAHCEYCPDCGNRINWPAVSKDILRIPAFLDAGAVFSILEQMKRSDAPSDSELASYLSDQFSGKEVDRDPSSSQSKAPILKASSGSAFVDYVNASGELTGRLYHKQYEEYRCPVCDGFVDAHELPILYELDITRRKKKPCRYCMGCGQLIDWSGITFNPEKYEPVSNHVFDESNYCEQETLA